MSIDAATIGREDWRGREVFTIDPEDAKDFDDAICVTERPDGSWELAVHIADVSHYVEMGSALDAEALARGTSVYLVDRVVPMLPHVLSSDVCSLRPDEDRFAVSVFATLDREGRRFDTNVALTGDEILSFRRTGERDATASAREGRSTDG